MIKIIFFLLFLSINGFPVDDHEDITRNAVYKIAAPLLKVDASKTYKSAVELFEAAYGKVPPAPFASIFDVPAKSKSTPSTKPFETFILDITKKYYEVELVRETDPAFFWDDLFIGDSLTRLRNDLKKVQSIKKSTTLKQIKDLTSRILMMIQNFYTNTNWLEEGNRFPPEFLVFPTRPDPPATVVGNSENDKGDSYHELYKVAYKLALDSTIMYFTQLRVIMNDDTKFKLLLGIQKGKTLAFNIDDTGSMQPYIDASRVHAQTIATSYSKSPNPPERYIIQTFNDPTVGETVITDKISVVTTTIGAVKANGGGDEPELCLTGLKLILDHLEVDSNAEIFVYTDAPAKDLYLLDEVRSIIKEKRPRITFLLAFIDVESDTATSRVFNEYETLSDVSRGDIVRVDARSIASTAEFLISRTEVAAENVIFLEKLTTSKSIEFNVDSTVSAAQIQLIGLETVHKVTVFDPTGASVKMNITLTTRSLTLMSVDTPINGKWRLAIELTKATKPYSVKMSFETGTSVYLRVVNEFDDGNGVEITGGLVANHEVAVIVDLVGFPSDNFPIINKIDLLKTDGSLARSLDVKQHKKTNRFYIDSLIVPNTNFQFKVSGVAKSGKSYERLYDRLFQVNDIKFDALLFSIRKQVYTIQYMFLNNRSVKMNLLVKAYKTANFKMNSFYESVKFSVTPGKEYKDIVVLERISVSDENLGSIKIEIYNSDTSTLLATQVVNMNNIPKSLY